MGNFVGVRFLWRGPDGFGNVLQVDSHARPRRRAAAHRVDENVRRLYMCGRVRMARFPPLESSERIVLSQRPRNLDQRMDRRSPSSRSWRAAR
jgi:hypothetical protein